MRKELPFAGYSVVKEHSVLVTFRVPGFELSLLAANGVSRLLGRQTPFERLAGHGGEYRARTGDLLVANQALSQLS